MIRFAPIEIVGAPVPLGSSNDTTLRIPLTSHISFYTLQKIEEMRQGRDLHFSLGNLDASGIIVNNFGVNFPVEVGIMVSPELIRYQQSEWISQLTEIDFKHVQLFELPYLDVVLYHKRHISRL